MEIKIIFNENHNKNIHVYYNKHS